MNTDIAVQHLVERVVEIAKANAIAKGSDDVASEIYEIGCYLDDALAEAQGYYIDLQERLDGTVMVLDDDDEGDCEHSFVDRNNDGDAECRRCGCRA